MFFPLEPLDPPCVPAKVDPSKLDPPAVLAEVARANRAGGGGKVSEHTSKISITNLVV